MSYYMYVPSSLTPLATTKHISYMNLIVIICRKYHYSIIELRSLLSHCTYTVHNEQQTDERTTRIEKKLLEIDLNDQNPPNSIIELSKAFDDLNASKSGPNRPFPFHHTYKVHSEKQRDERTTRTYKKLMEKMIKISPTASLN